MIEVLTAARKSNVLGRSKLPCMAHLPSVNLTSGCAHGCVYCYAQGYGSYPGRGKVVLYTNLLEKLRDEIGRKRTKPSAIWFSPSSDLFQPVPEVLELAWQVLDFLLRAEIGVVFLTKGRIPRRHLNLLKAHAPLVRAEIGLGSLDRKVARLVEPGAATPQARLQCMRQLVQAGIATQARVDPIFPGLNDDPDTMHALCGALAEAGVKELSAATLFLRPAIIGGLRQRLRRAGKLTRLNEAFAQGKWLRLTGSQGPVLALPAARRRQIFDWLMAIARQHGITAHVCACKNPDLTADGCNLSGRWALPVVVERQLPLFVS